jgi:hypothetical protein
MSEERRTREEWERITASRRPRIEIDPGEHFDLLEEMMDLFLGEDPEESTPSRRLYSTQPSKGRAKGYAPWKPQKKTRIIIAQVQEILEHYEAELPLTARQIFYRGFVNLKHPQSEVKQSSRLPRRNRALSGAGCQAAHLAPRPEAVLHLLAVALRS